MYRLEGVDWIYLALDRDKQRAVMKAVMNPRVRRNPGISRLTEKICSSRKTRLLSLWYLEAHTSTFFQTHIMQGKFHPRTGHESSEGE